jgi:hypothetical protein
MPAEVTDAEILSSFCKSLLPSTARQYGTKTL